MKKDLTQKIETPSGELMVEMRKQPDGTFKETTTTVKEFVVAALNFVEVSAQGVPQPITPQKMYERGKLIAQIMKSPDAVELTATEIDDIKQQMAKCGFNSYTYYQIATLLEA